MILVNKTRIDSKILEGVLVAAGRAVGARTKNVVVKVLPKKGWGGSGFAEECDAVPWGKKTATAATPEYLPFDDLQEYGYFFTDGGAITIRLSDHPCYIPQSVRSFFATALHEWAHIKDFQTGGLEFATPSQGRRCKHKKRPEELRAFNAVDAIKLTRYESKIQALITACEELAKARKWITEEQLKEYR